MKFYVSLNNKPRFYINFERDKKDNSGAPIMCEPISDAIEAFVKAWHSEISVENLYNPKFTTVFLTCN